MATPRYAGRHRSDDAPVGAKTPTVRANAPGRTGTKGPTETRRRGPQHDSGETKRAPSGAAKAAKDGAEKRRRTESLIQEGREYAHREAMRRTDGRPSIAGRAAAGAAAGTATGAAVGGPAGAAAGAVLGGTGGALAGRKAKKAYDMAMSGGGGFRRILVAEFLVCMVIAALSPLTDRKKDEPATAHMKRLTAIMGLFFVLGLVSAGGRGAAKLAAGFGGLVTVTLAISDRDLFMKIGSIFGNNATEPDGPQEIADLIEPGQGRDHPGAMQ
jgi:hypothetical protein